MKTKKIFGLLIGLCLILSIVSCSAPQEGSDETKVNTKVNPTSTPQNTNAASESTTVVTPAMSSEVEELLTKSRSITNYRCMVDVSTPQTYELYYWNGLMRKMYVDPVKVDNYGNWYNEIYLDSTLQTALGICSELGVSCSTMGKKTLPRSYVQEKPVPDPLEMVRGIDYAEKVGVASIDNRDTVIIAYTNAQGQKEKAWLDTYSGFPMQQLIYEVVDGEEKEITEHTFTRLIVGTVKKSEVALPSGYGS